MKLRKPLDKVLLSLPPPPLPCKEEANIKKKRFACKLAERRVEELTTEVVMVEEAAHPYAFHVSGPRNVASPTWKDLIYSSWKDANYKRTAMSCFIQAVYLLELDKQENRTAENALAPAWWMIFRYKLVQTLIDERDGSIFGAVLEWDRPAALADLVLVRPSGAPKAVLALRGTLLKSPTIRRDIEDDLRFLACESLKGSVRFKGAFEALKSMAERYGSCNICVAGHSLGAGFALQVGKALAKEGLYVDAHLFNPPSVSLSTSMKNVGEKAGSAWKKIKSMLPSTSEARGISDEVEENSAVGLKKNWLLNFYGEKSPVQLNKWVPHLYVNNSDYICCSYTDSDQPEDKSVEKKNMGPANRGVAAKLFVQSKGKQRFLEAHGLEQWWSDDLELQLTLHNSKVISRQLKSLYSLPASQQILGKP